MITKEILANAIKKRRSEMGLTQVKLAELANISQGMVQKIEYCKGWPTAPILERLATALGSSVDQLLLDPTQPKPTDPIQSQLESIRKDIQAISTLSAEERQLLTIYREIDPAHRPDLIEIAKTLAQPLEGQELNERLLRDTLARRKT